MTAFSTPVQLNRSVTSNRPVYTETDFMTVDKLCREGIQQAIAEAASRHYVPKRSITFNYHPDEPGKPSPASDLVGAYCSSSALRKLRAELRADGWKSRIYFTPAGFCVPDGIAHGAFFTLSITPLSRFGRLLQAIFG